MVRVFTALSATLLAAVAVSAGKLPNWDTNKPSSELYVSVPDENTIWTVGQNVQVSWLMNDADVHTKDNLEIFLVNNIKTYIIGKQVDARNDQGNCDDLGIQGKFCATYTWEIPHDVLLGKYQVAVTDPQNNNLIRYTKFFEVRD